MLNVAFTNSDQGPLPPWRELFRSLLCFPLCGAVAPSVQSIGPDLTDSFGVFNERHYHHHHLRPSHYADPDNVGYTKKIIMERTRMSSRLFRKLAKHQPSPSAKGQAPASSSCSDALVQRSLMRKDGWQAQHRTFRRRLRTESRLVERDNTTHHRTKHVH